MGWLFKGSWSKGRAYTIREHYKWLSENQIMIEYADAFLVNDDSFSYNIWMKVSICTFDMLIKLSVQ